MNKTLSTTLIIIAVLAVTGSLFFAGNMYARANAYGRGASVFGWGNRSYGPGMMGRAYNGGYGPGMMMGGRGYGMMNGYGWNNGTGANVSPLSIDQAKAAVEKYIRSAGLQGLEIGEVMVFDNNAYVVVEESDTGFGAFELLVDPVSRIAYPEHGPNMMWNLKYSGLNTGSMMSGMMNGFGWSSAVPADVSSEMTVTAEQAVKYAQEFLDATYAGETSATDPIPFYGYYTIDFEKDGQIVGMLSVNGYSGQVFLHTWHGAFIEESE